MTGLRYGNLNARGATVGVSFSFAASSNTRLGGVPLILIDPRNTSGIGSVCGHCEKKNRKSQAEFLCGSCGHSMNADHNAALNIGAKGAFTLSMVSRCAA